MSEMNEAVDIEGQVPAIAWEILGRPGFSHGVLKIDGHDISNLTAGFTLSANASGVTSLTIDLVPSTWQLLGVVLPDSLHVRVRQWVYAVQLMRAIADADAEQLPALVEEARKAADKFYDV